MDQKSGKSHKMEQNPLRENRIVLKGLQIQDCKHSSLQIAHSPKFWSSFKVSFLIMMLKAVCTYVNFLAEDDENNHISQSSSIIFHCCTKLKAQV